jgi:hypothetical protein
MKPGTSNDECDRTAWTVREVKWAALPGCDWLPLSVAAQALLPHLAAEASFAFQTADRFTSPVTVNRGGKAVTRLNILPLTVLESHPIHVLCLIHLLVIPF